MTMFSTRTAPWTKLGTIIEEATTVSEALNLSNLNFKVTKRPISFTTSNGDYRHINDRVAVVRDDTEQVISVMSSDYSVLQYEEAFDFIDTIGPKFVAAGALKGGKQGFMVIEGPDVNVLGGDDPHDLFAILRTSHDGSRAVEIAIMPLRGRCMNQLSLSNLTVNAPARWSIRHTPYMHQKLIDARNAIHSMEEYARSFEVTAETLVSVAVDDSTAQILLEDIFPDKPKREEQINTVMNLWHTADTVGFDKTGWGLVNAVSDYLEWNRALTTNESRFLNALQGRTHTMINKIAQNLILAA